MRSFLTEAVSSSPPSGLRFSTAVAPNSSLARHIIHRQTARVNGPYALSAMLFVVVSTAFMITGTTTSPRWNSRTTVLCTRARESPRSSWCTAFIHAFPSKMAALRRSPTMSRRSPSCRLGSRRVAVPQTHWRAPSFAKPPRLTATVVLWCSGCMIWFGFPPGTSIWRRRISSRQSTWDRLLLRRSCPAATRSSSTCRPRFGLPTRPSTSASFESTLLDRRTLAPAHLRRRLRCFATP